MAAKDEEKRKTTYVVLIGMRYDRKVEVEASNAEQAIRMVANGAPGSYTATPKRSLHHVAGTYEEVPPPFKLVPVAMPPDDQLDITEAMPDGRSVMSLIGAAEDPS